MEIMITLHTAAGDVVTRYLESELTQALVCIKAYIEDRKPITVVYGLVF